MNFNAEKFSSQEELPEEKLMDEAGQELIGQLEKKKGIFEVLGRSDILRRIVLIGALFSGAETALAQGQEDKYKESIESAKKAVIELASSVKENADRTGVLKIAGKEDSNFFEKDLSGRKVHVNDRYMYVQKETPEGKVVFCVDRGLDGEIDQVILVPGKLSEGTEGRAEESFIVDGFESNIKDISDQVEMEKEASSMEQELGDASAYSKRTMFVLENEGEKRTWYAVSPGKGEVGKGKEGEIRPQVIGESLITETLAELKEGESDK